MLTAAQKTLVQETFAIITPIADDAAALFYHAEQLAASGESAIDT